MLTARTPARTRAPRRGAARGLSLVELLIGSAVGLIVIGGALTLFVQNVVGSRHMLVETRLNQDMRTALDLVTRDLRRAGYWGNAIQGTTLVGAAAGTAANPYSPVSADDSNQAVEYRFSRDAAENNAVGNNEQFGFRIHDGRLQMQTASGDWNDLTDRRAMTVTAFAATPTQTTLHLGSLCPRACAAGTPNCPTITVRSFAVTMSATSGSDDQVKRTMRGAVRLRNDQLAGVCPA